MNVGKLKSLLKRRVVIPAIVTGAALSLGAYEVMRPTSAVMAAPSPAPAASALDDSSVGALLSLDQAMEALAACHPCRGQRHRYLKGRGTAAGQRRRR